MPVDVIVKSQSWDEGRTILHGTVNKFLLFCFGLFCPVCVKNYSRQTILVQFCILSSPSFLFPIVTSFSKTQTVDPLVTSPPSPSLKFKTSLPRGVGGEEGRVGDLGWSLMVLRALFSKVQVISERGLCFSSMLS